MFILITSIILVIIIIAYAGTWFYFKSEQNKYINAYNAAPARVNAGTLQQEVNAAELQENNLRAMIDNIPAELEEDIQKINAERDNTIAANIRDMTAAIQ